MVVIDRERNQMSGSFAEEAQLLKFNVVVLRWSQSVQKSFEEQKGKWLLNFSTKYELQERKLGLSILILTEM